MQKKKSRDIVEMHKNNCSATIDIGQNKKKELRDRPKSARIKLPHRIQVKEGLSLNEQYNTRNEVSSIPNEIF